MFMITPSLRAVAGVARLLCVVALASTAATRTQAQMPDAAVTPTQVPDTAAAPGSPPSARASAVAVAIGDRVRLKVWREPGLSDDLTVDERGEIAFPRLGRMHVAGTTIAALQDTLLTRYAEYLRDPSVTVTVFRRIGVQGQVRAPNLYYVDATKTLREVLAEAGGVTDAANMRGVTILRDGRRIRVGRLQNGVAPAVADLRSGDQIVVPRRSWYARNSVAALSTAAFAATALIQLVNTLRAKK